MSQYQFGLYGDLELTGVEIPTSLDYSDSFGFNPRERIAGRAVLESVSDDLLKLRLTFNVHQQQGIVPDEVRAKWFELAIAKQPKPLTLSGVYRGEFVITNIRTNVTKTADDGHAIALKFDIDLLESVGITEEESKPRKSGFTRKSTQTATGNS